MSVDLIAPEKKNRTKEESEYKASTTYQKLYFWLDTNLPGVIVVDVDKEDDLYIANLSANIMMYCPGGTGDDTIIQLIHSKLSSLAKNELLIGEIHLRGDDSTLQYTFDFQDNGYSLPETTEEYYTEGTARDKTPWWARDDGFCFEFIRPAETEITDDELFGDIVDPMDEFNKLVIEAADMHIGSVKEPARIVQVEKWKPKKIE